MAHFPQASSDKLTKALHFSRSKTDLLLKQRGVNPAFKHDWGRGSQSLRRGAKWHRGSGHATNLYVHCLMSLFLWLWMNMTENLAEDHANISATTYKCTASVPKGQSTGSWCQHCWQTGGALKAYENRSQHWSLLPDFVCLTGHHPTTFFTYTAKLFKRKQYIIISIHFLD